MHGLPYFSRVHMRHQKRGCEEYSFHKMTDFWKTLCSSHREDIVLDAVRFACKLTCILLKFRASSLVRRCDSASPDRNKRHNYRLNDVHGCSAQSMSLSG